MSIPRFDSAEHPRAGDGTFTTQSRAESEVDLSAPAADPPRVDAQQYMVALDSDDLRELRAADLRPGMVVVKPQAAATYLTGPRQDGTGTGVQFIYGFPQGVEYPVTDTSDTSVTVLRPDGIEVAESFVGKADVKVIVKHSSLDAPARRDTRS